MSTNINPIKNHNGFIVPVYAIRLENKRPEICSGCVIDCNIMKEPNNASEIPTEHVIRYFHVATTESLVLCRHISGALEIVVASIAIHVSIMWSEIAAKLIADTKNSNMEL